VLDYALRGTAVNRIVNTEFTPIWDAAAVVQPIAKDAARAVILVYVAWAARRLRAAEDRWTEVRRLGPGLLAVLGAVLIERNLWLLVIPLGQMLVALGRWARAEPGGGGRDLAVTAAVLATGGALHLVYAAQIGWSNAEAWAILGDPRTAASHLDEGLIPIGCVERLASAPEGTRLFTLRMWASYAIWRLPQARVFYDGRNLEYGLDIHEAGARVWAGAPGAAEILDATGTNRVIARPGWNELPGVQGGPWRALAVGPRCAVFGRVKARLGP